MSRAGYIRVSNDIGASTPAIELADELYLAALGLFTLCLCYCNRQLTDGFIPERAMRHIAAGSADPDPVVSELERVGFLAAVDGGWRIPSYLEWQRSRREIEAASESARQSAETRWRNANRNANRNAKEKRREEKRVQEKRVNPSSDAKPAPDERDAQPGDHEDEEVLVGELVPAPSKREAAADASFDRFWSAYPRHEDRKRARTAWTHVSAAERELAIGVAGIMSELIAAGRQERRFAPLATTFIRGKRWEDWREGVPAAWAGEGASRAAAQADAYNRALQRARERERAT